MLGGTKAELGGIDILINSAGVIALAPVEEFKLADFDRLFAINVRAVFVATQAAAKHMQRGGRIINIGSCNAERMPFPGGAVYAMSKSALQGFVQGVARDLGARGITINNVQPGPINTDGNPDKTEFAEMLKKQFLALPRYGTVEEVAAMVAYLAGPEAGFVTGASLTIDGGFNAQRMNIPPNEIGTLTDFSFPDAWTAVEVGAVPILCQPSAVGWVSV